MVTDVPDSAYELCSKYAPNCDDTSSSTTFTSSQQIKKTETISKNSESSSKKSKSKLKLSKKKSKKSSSKSEASANSENTRSLKPNRRQIISQDNFDELENAGFGFNGEDDYYDSLNSGNEDGVFGSLNTERTNLPFNPVETNLDNEFDESFNREPGLTTSENVKKLWGVVRKFRHVQF
jgi:hypothetical protein